MSAERDTAVAERRAAAPEARRELARRVAAIVDDKQGEDIVCLDVRELVSYTDYLVIATARNERQAKAIHDEVHLRLKKDHGMLPARVEGESEARWVLLDYLDCVLHVFVPELRDRYRLEKLWGEAQRLELGLQGEATSRGTWGRAGSARRHRGDAPGRPTRRAPAPRGRQGTLTFAPIDAGIGGGGGARASGDRSSRRAGGGLGALLGFADRRAAGLPADASARREHGATARPRPLRAARARADGDETR